MKKRIYLGLFALVLTAIISSCSTSSDVASNRKIQKRKYNKGFFVGNNNLSLKKKNEEVGFVTQDEIIENENKVNIESVVNVENKSVVKEVSVVTNAVNHLNSTVDKRDNNISANENNVGFSNLIVDNKSVKNNVQPEKLNKKVKITQKEKKGSSGGDMLILLVILALLIPFIAVGIKTDWDLIKVLICLILCILFWLPGVIYALLVVFDII